MKEAAAGGNLKYKNENSHLSKLIIFNIIWVREKTNSLMSHLTAYLSELQVNMFVYVLPIIFVYNIKSK